MRSNKDRVNETLANLAIHNAKTNYKIIAKALVLNAAIVAVAATVAVIVTDKNDK